MTVLLGIVGTPAAGKSTVAKMLADWGADWIDADTLAKDCLKEPSVMSRLVERFGEAVRTAGGEPDRKAIADRVFGEDAASIDALRYLESVVHPRVRTLIGDRIASAASQGVAVALLDVPLLFESGWSLSCDSVWCVDALREIRLSRAATRRWDASELDRREARQLPIETKCRLSNVVMRNDSTLTALRKNVRPEWEKLARIGFNSRAATELRDERHCLSD